jgi:hypothetical protein
MPNDIVGYMTTATACPAACSSDGRIQGDQEGMTIISGCASPH